MNIAPQLSYKKLTQTEAGELVHMDWGGPGLALIAFAGERRVIVFLYGRDVDAKPTYLIPRVDAKVASYGKNYLLEIDQDPNFIDVHERSYYNTAGAVLVGASTHLLYVAPMRGSGSYDILRYNWLTGEIGSPTDVVEGINFGKWRIWLPLNGDIAGPAQQPIFSFSLEPSKA